MNTLNFLNSISNKKSGDTLSAEEWNKVVDTILKGVNYSFDTLNTFTIESFVDNTWSSVSYTEGSEVNLTAGGTYRLSGYTNNTTVKIAGTTGAATKILLNNVIMISNRGYNIEYCPEDAKKTLTIEVLANTENYLIQNSTATEYLSLGNIYSNNNAEVIGSGYLGLFNSVGHGIKSSELNMTGDVKVYANVSHDALHGTKIVNIYWGQYYVDTAKDAVGTGAQDAEDVGKLRGIIRVFGGKFYINTLIDKTIFDAKYSCMQYTKAEDGESYSIVTDEVAAAATEDFTSVYLLYSGIFSRETTTIECFNTEYALFATYDTYFPAGTKYYREYLAQTTGKVLDDTTEVTAVDGKYQCSGATITVQGKVSGTIVVNKAKAEVHL